ncbi:MAG TPA: DUF2550 domain-containing protein [Jatrophihabitans sp.]|nr:DUF2550 domain-containing protein [Jatrophihabitans sp.]
MHTVDVVVACVAVVIVLALVAILARQRQMLRTTGAVPIAVQRGNRWLYGIGRYVGGELRWYRALGVGTRPSRVLQRGQVEVLGRRSPLPSEQGSIPATSVVVACRADGETFSLAIGEGAYTAFVSWLESASPPSR